MLGAGLFVAFVSASPVFARSDYVVVSATAQPTYHRLLEDGSLRPQSYVFSRGKQFGNVRNASLAPDEFDRVLHSLAPALAKREYWPVKDPSQADLLIVVHWGETEIYDDPLADFMADSLNTAMSEYMASADEAGNADPGRLNELKRMQSMTAQDALNTSQVNAEMLGFRTTLDKEGKRYIASETERTLKTELAENRYFLVLMAWDYAALRAKQPSKLQWVTRMSVRAVGHKFSEATSAMIAQAAPHFGAQSEGLVRTRTTFDGRKTEVEIGESTVIEETTSQP
jgi:hypothetical protein